MKQKANKKTPVKASRPTETVNQTIVVKQAVKEPTRDAFFAALSLLSPNDLANYGKLQRNTYFKALELAKELDIAYYDYTN